MSETLRGTIVQISRLNPQTNQYDPVGKMPFVAIRKENTIACVVLNPKTKQPSILVPSSPQVDWTIQNNVYGSYLDQRQIRWLFLFGSPTECLLYSAIVLSGKLNASPGPLCVIDAKGPPINPNQPIKVNYKAYDLQAKKVDQPCMAEDNFTFSSNDDTPLKEIIKNGTGGSTYLIKFPHNVVAVVESIAEKNELPTILGKEIETKAEEPEEKKAAPAKGKRRTSEAKQAQEQQQQQQAPAQRPPPTSNPLPASVPASDAVQPAPMYDEQLETIRQEMQSKFNELSNMVASLRRRQIVQSNTPATADVLVKSVQRLLEENQKKDELIAEKQQLIDLLKQKNSDTRERDQLRIQVAELGSKLSAQRQATKAKIEEQKTLNDRIAELQSQIVNTTVEAESNISILRKQLEEETQNQLQELEQTRQQLEWSVKTAEEDLVNIRKQFEAALSENKALKSQSSRDIGAELQKLKQNLPKLIEKHVREMVQGVFSMVQSNFDADEEYDGGTVMKAIRNALQKQANDMLSGLESDDDEEEED